MKTIGVLLLVAGIATLIWSGFSYTKREKMIDAGPVHISADRQKTVSWPPYAGERWWLPGWWFCW
jgi:hypothetical protein